MAYDTDEILTVSEIAERLRVPNSWVYGHADLLGAYRLGKYLRFSWKRALQCLEAGLQSEEVGVTDEECGITAQRPKIDIVNSGGCNGCGTTREQN
jgi:hypothetical protein